MKLARREWLKLSAMAGTGLILASCQPAATPTPKPAAKPAEKATAPPAKEEKVEVTYLVRSDLSPTMKEWEDVTVKEFEEMHPNIKVNVIGVPWGDYNAKLLAMYAADMQPEISANYAAGFATFYANDAIVALDDFVASKGVDLSVFEPACIAALTRGGKLWAMPLAHMPVILFYNRDLFDKAGVDPPPKDWSDTSWTTDKLLEVSRKLSHDVDDPTKAEWGVDFETGQLGVMSWAWGADPFNDKGGPELTQAYQDGIVTEAFYTAPKVMAMHKYRSDLAFEHKVSPRPSDTDILKQVQNFTLMTGRIAMTNAGGWQFNQFLVVKPSWKWGVAPLPYGPGGKNTSPLFNDSWMLSAGCREPDAGFELLTYLTVGKGAEHYARITGFMAANTNLYSIFFDSIAEVPNLAMTREEVEATTLQAFEYGYVTPGKTLDRYPEWNNAYNQTTSPIWNNEVSVEEGMQGVQEKFESLIAAIE